MALTSQKQHLYWRYGFAFIVLIAGTLLMAFDIGDAFLGFASVGTWLLYIGCIMLAIITLQTIKNKKRVVDERMQAIAAQAARITFTVIILAAFIIMVIDGIAPIALSYALFMSYFICGIVLVYLIAYKLLLRYR